MEGSGRGLILDTIVAVTWKNRGKIRNVSGKPSSRPKFEPCTFQIKFQNVSAKVTCSFVHKNHVCINTDILRTGRACIRAPKRYRGAKPRDSFPWPRYTHRHTKYPILPDSKYSFVVENKNQLIFPL